MAGLAEFERTTDGRRFSTDVETTQPNAEALLYWSTGLTAAYFEGALERATNRRPTARKADPDIEARLR